MIVTVHGGHAAQGKAYCGAAGLLDESKEDRLIKDSVIKYLKQGGAAVYDCTVDSGTSQSNVLKQICSKCNAVKADINLSIHLNAGRNDSAGDGKQGGFEVYATAYSGIKKEAAERITAKMQSLGFGLHGDPYKTSSSLYFLNKTKQPSLLLEICFVDDRDDYNRYTKVGYDAIGKAIAEGLLNKTIPGTNTGADTATGTQTPADTIIANGLIHAGNFLDGVTQTDLSKAKGRVLQRGMNMDYGRTLNEDGIIGTKSKNKLGSHYVRKGEKQYMVTAAAILMMLNGIDPKGVGCPGKYESGLVAAAKSKFGGDGTKITAQQFLKLV